MLAFEFCAKIFLNGLIKTFGFKSQLLLGKFQGFLSKKKENFNQKENFPHIFFNLIEIFHFFNNKKKVQMKKC